MKLREVILSDDRFWDLYATAVNNTDHDGELSFLTNLKKRYIRYKFEAEISEKEWNWFKSIIDRW